MQLTRKIELVFPRSGQVVAVQVPTDIYEQEMLVNKTLLSSISRLRACVPSELLNRLHLQ